MQDMSERVSARFGLVASTVDREWSSEDLAQIRDRIEKSIELADTLRAVPLNNGDSPDAVFVPYRSNSE